jgi:hypothetical protein
MTEQIIPVFPSLRALELFQPDPNVFYSLEEAAYLAGVSRRSFLVYCRVNLVRPVFQPPYGVMEFTEESIYKVRRMEYLRSIHGTDLAWLNTVLNLLDKVERLHAELRFFRDN